MIQFRPPADGKDRQQRIRECQSINGERATQKVRELEAKKNAGSRRTPAAIFGAIIGAVMGLILIA